MNIIVAIIAFFAFTASFASLRISLLNMKADNEERDEIRKTDKEEREAIEKKRIEMWEDYLCRKL